MDKANLFILFGLAAAALTAQPLPDTVRAYELEWGTQPLKVDADFSDWRRLVWSDPFTQANGVSPTNTTCRFALMRDRTNLYIAFRLNGAYQKSDAHSPHDGDIWHGNTVAEFFFARPGGGAGYVQLSLAANGDRQDAADGDSFVTPEWEAATVCDATGWQGEIRVPFRELDIDLDVLRHYEFRMNVSVGLPRQGLHDKSVSLSWSNAGGPGYRNHEDMGFVVHNDFRAACDRAKADYRVRYGADCTLKTVPLRDEKGYRAFKNDYLAACAQQDRARTAALATKLAARPDLPPLLPQTWPPDRIFGETPAAQAEVLEGALAAVGREPRLDYVAAVNEIVHRAFALSARHAVKDLQFELSELTGDNGAIIPAAKLHVEKFAFLHPVPGYHHKRKNLNLGYPEIIEPVHGPLALKAGESLLFRLYVDTRGAKPGRYAGTCTACAVHQQVKFPVSLEVTPVVLPLAQERTFPVYIFTTIPWGGASAELWARFFSDHYLTDVLFEHPAITVGGQPVQPYAGNAYIGWAKYIEGMTATNPIPSPDEIRVDVKRFQMDDRLRACARHHLRVLMSNRNGFMKSEHFPAVVAAFAACGIPPGDIIYKLGDEDPSLLFLPVAKRIREIEPRIRVTMIPSGTSYWDMKPAIEGFTNFTFSRAAFKMGPQGDEDLKYLRSKGLVLSRYLNDASWAGRTLPVKARAEPWEALIVDGVDGYACWTANFWPEIGHRIPYNGFRRDIAFQDLPPENQIPDLLVYVRNLGGVYHPVSCIRLENIRDGLIDALYFRLAQKACAARGDADGLKTLAAIRTTGKRTITDYDAARRALSDLILRR